MTEGDALDIVAMIEGYWNRQVTNVTKDMYVKFLLKHDAELVTLAVAKLAETQPQFPKISDLRDMLGNVTGSTPALEPGICPTCYGDKVVIVQTRPSVQTLWMKDKGFEPATDSGYDETVPCPDCNADANTDYSVLGRRYRPMDEPTVRERMGTAGTNPTSPPTNDVPLWVRRWMYARFVKSPPDMRPFREQGQHAEPGEVVPDDLYVEEALTMPERDIASLAAAVRAEL